MKIEANWFSKLFRGSDPEGAKTAVKERLTSAENSDASLIASYEEKCSWPNLYYKKIGALISLLMPRQVVEIGVAHGFHARHILREHPSVEYIGVDPYVAGYDSKDPFDKDIGALFGVNPSEGMERLFSVVSDGLREDYGERARILRVSSTVAAREFMDQSLEFVFIDGDHRFQSVISDLKSWWPKIKPGGAIVGDDYSWPGVERAVTCFFASVRHDVLLLETAGIEHTSFFVIKKLDG